MKESHSEGLATHTGPESCVAAREGGAEALTGERSGRVLSRERNLHRDADTVGGCGRLHSMHRYRKVQRGPARSQTPSTYGSTSHGNREIPDPPKAVLAVGRIGKSKDTRR
jgi:RNA-directed DNA polymerase